MLCFVQNIYFCQRNCLRNLRQTSEEYTFTNPNIQIQKRRQNMKHLFKYSFSLIRPYLFSGF